MFKNHVYGIDLGSNMIKIYSQNSNEILKEKNTNQFLSAFPDQETGTITTALLRASIIIHGAAKSTALLLSSLLIEAAEI